MRSSMNDFTRNYSHVYFLISTFLIDIFIRQSKKIHNSTKKCKELLLIYFNIYIYIIKYILIYIYYLYNIFHCLSQFSCKNGDIRKMHQMRIFFSNLVKKNSLIFQISLLKISKKENIYQDFWRNFLK